jgi:hypothetical protein
MGIGSKSAVGEAVRFLREMKLLLTACSLLDGCRKWIHRVNLTSDYVPNFWCFRRVRHELAAGDCAGNFYPWAHAMCSHAQHRISGSGNLFSLAMLADVHRRESA